MNKLIEMSNRKISFTDMISGLILGSFSKTSPRVTVNE